jgi:hypothetical protein
VKRRSMAHCHFLFIDIGVGKDRSHGAVASVLAGGAFCVLFNAGVSFVYNETKLNLMPSLGNE